MKFRSLQFSVIWIFSYHIRTDQIVLGRTNSSLKDHKSICESRKLHSKPFSYFFSLGAPAFTMVNYWLWILIVKAHKETTTTYNNHTNHSNFLNGQYHRFSASVKSQETRVYRWTAKYNGPVFNAKWLFHWTETVNKCVWLRMARMEMDSTLKTSGRLFQVCVS